MASNYGNGFGFRRSYLGVQEGRQKVPATGTFKQGDVVTLDPANPGFIKLAPANAPVSPGVTGLLVQEDSFLPGYFENPIHGTNDFEGQVYNGRQCAIWTGDNLKVWYRNVPAKPARNGRPAVAAQTRIPATGLNVGDFIAWDGAKFVKGTDETTAIGRVTLAAADYVEFALAK